MVLKQDGSGTPMLPTDFRIGLDVGILGRSIRIYDCDQYTREFFDVSLQAFIETREGNSIMSESVFNCLTLVESQPFYFDNK